MKRAASALCLCLAAAAPGASPATRPADNASAKLYAVSVTFTETRDGHTRTLAEPVMVVRDGARGSFQTGEIATVDDVAVPMDIGLRADVCVREKGDRLRVSLNVQGSDVGSRDADGLVVRSSGAHGEMTVRPGDVFVMDLGAGRSARVCVMAAGR